MPNPYELKSRKQIWLDDKGKIVPATSPARKTQVEEHTYANGEVYKVRWDSASESWSDFELIETNKAIADQFEAQQKAEKATDSASAWTIEDRADGSYRVNKATGEVQKIEGLPGKTATPSAAAEWTTKTDNAGNTWRVNEVTGEKEKLFEAGPDNSIWTNPSTGAQWLLDKRTGTLVKQLSDDIPGYRPSGVPAPKEYAPQYPRVITQGRGAYKVDPYTGAIEKVYDFPEEEPTAWNREQEDRKYDWWKQQEEGQNERRRQDAEDAMRRQRLTSAVGLAGNIADATQAAIPYAALPGQTHFLGADLAEKMSGRIGIPYRRDDFQSQMIPFDGLQAWRLAQGALGVK